MGAIFKLTSLIKVLKDVLLRHRRRGGRRRGPLVADLERRHGRGRLHREGLLPVSGLPGRLGFGRGCWHGLGGGRGGLGQPHLEVGDPGLGPTNYGCTPAQALGARGDSSAGRSQLGVPVELWKTMRFLRFLPVSVPGLEEELGH